jgi:hypothetical protein
MADRDCKRAFCECVLEPFLADRTTDTDHGTIYAIALPFMPKAVKIGRTRMSVQERLYVLNTSTPEDFIVYWHLRVRDHTLVEMALHAALAGRRISKNREFFTLDRIEVVELERLLRGTVWIGGDPPSSISRPAMERLKEVFGADA